MAHAGSLDRSRAATADSDVVVIGAGPAGCSAARLLHTWGHRVTLVTRPAPSPALAESIPPSAIRLLEHLDWRSRIDSVGFLRSTGNTVLWDARGASPMDAARQAFYRGGALGYQVDRAVLNRLLLAATVESGVSVIPDATVSGVQGGVVSYQCAAGDGAIWARWVLDCSGRSSVVARLGWRRGVPHRRTLAIAGIWERSEGWPLPDPTHTLVESHAEGWAWSVPVSLTLRHVTVMLDPHLTSVPSLAALSHAYEAQLAQAPALHALTRAGTLVAEPFAREASPYGAHQVAAANLLLVGDAASFVDPLSSYGIKKALASAWLAAVVVNTCLADSAMLRPALELYEARERAMYDGLEQSRTQLARAALDAETASRFWTTRAESELPEKHAPNEIIDVDVLRRDPAIRAALEDLKRRESISLAVGAALEYVRHPAVAGDRIVMEKRLRLPGGDAETLRYIRNVDLVALIELAASASQVPDVYEIYCRRVAPVPLPDFLGALAFLLARRVLRFA